MAHSESRWYWTDDLARILTDSGKASRIAVQRWIAEPVAVRGEGEAMAIAEALFQDESDEPHKAA